MQTKAECSKLYHLWALPLGPSLQEAHLTSVSDFWAEEGTQFPGSAPVHTAQDTVSHPHCHARAWLTCSHQGAPSADLLPTQAVPWGYFTPDLFRSLWMAALPLSYLLTRTLNLVSFGKCYCQQFFWSHPTSVLPYIQLLKTPPWSWLPILSEHTKDAIHC